MTHSNASCNISFGLDTTHTDKKTTTETKATQRLECMIPQSVLSLRFACSIHVEFRFAGEKWILWQHKLYLTLAEMCYMYHPCHVEKVCAHLLAIDTISLNHVKRHCFFQAKVFFLPDWLFGCTRVGFCCNLEWRSVSCLATICFSLKKKNIRSNSFGIHEW